jgi:hypothetical protein
MNNGVRSTAVPKFVKETLRSDLFLSFLGRDYGIDQLPSLPKRSWHHDPYKFGIRRYCQLSGEGRKGLQTTARKESDDRLVNGAKFIFPLSTWLNPTPT